MQKISRDPRIKSNPKKYIRRKTQDNQLYNESFTERELKAAINNRQHQGTIHLQMIKKLPPETLKYLLDLNNKFWEEGIVPER